MKLKVLAAALLLFDASLPAPVLRHVPLDCNLSGRWLRLQSHLVTIGHNIKV